MAAPSPQPPKRNWWPVEMPGVMGSVQRIGLWVGSRPSQAGASIGGEPTGPLRGRTFPLVSALCDECLGPLGYACHTPWVD